MNETADPRPCPRCGRSFTCGMLAGAQRCWCVDMPRIAPRSEVDGCYCPECLASVAAEQQAGKITSD